MESLVCQGNGEKWLEIFEDGSLKIERAFVEEFLKQIQHKDSSQLGSFYRIITASFNTEKDVIPNADEARALTLLNVLFNNIPGIEH